VRFGEEWGTDGMVYSVAATYRYEFGEQQYTGHRVDIIGGSSSDHKLHLRRYKELAWHRDENIPFRAYVNPEHPEEAVLYCEPDIWMYAMLPFGALFAGVGMAIITLGVVLVRRKRRLSRIAASRGEREWDLRKEWKEGRIRAPALRDLILAWLAGVGSTLFVSFFIILMIGDDPPLVARLAIGAFAIMAIFFLLRAVLLTVRQFVIGTPVLCLQEVPIVPGREVEATVRTARPLRAERWRFRLECHVPQTDDINADQVRSVLQRLERLPGKTFKARRTSWYGQRAYRLELPPPAEASTDRRGRTLAPVAVPVPAGAPESSLEPTFAVSWVLEAQAWSFPFRLKARFLLPVFYASPEEIETKVGAFE